MAFQGTHRISGLADLRVHVLLVYVDNSSWNEFRLEINDACAIAFTSFVFSENMHFLMPSITSQHLL